MTAGQYADALDAYEQVLSKYPDADEAARARISRDALSELLAARARLARLTAGMKAQDVEIARMRDELSRARAENARLTADTDRARAEIARVTADADRLRADLEQLKRIDIDLERPRK